MILLIWTNQIPTWKREKQDGGLVGLSVKTFHSSSFGDNTFASYKKHVSVGKLTVTKNMIDLRIKN